MEYIAIHNVSGDDKNYFAIGEVKERIRNKVILGDIIFEFKESDYQAGTAIKGSLHMDLPKVINRTIFDSLSGARREIITEIFFHRSVF